MNKKEALLAELLELLKEAKEKERSSKEYDQMIENAEKLASAINEEEKIEERYSESEIQAETEREKLKFELEKLKFEREKLDKETRNAKIKAFVEGGVQVLKVVVFIIGVAYNFKMAAAWMTFEKTAIVPKSMAAFVSTKLPKML